MYFLDWYLILTPIFGILIILTLISFKLSLKDQPEVSKYNIQQIKATQTKQINSSSVKQSVKEDSIWQTSEYLKTFSYFARNHSFIEICMTRQAKNKLPMLSSMAIIGMISLFLPQSYFLCIIGVFIVISFVIAQSFFEKDPADFMEQQRQQFDVIRSEVKIEQNSAQNGKKYIYFTYTMITCAVGLYICGNIYGNYLNSYLTAFALTFLINSVLDLVVVRPIAFLIISAPLKFHLRTQHLIINQNMRQIIENLPPKVPVLDLATNMSPKKKQSNSPTKVPKAVLKKKNSENEGLINALESLKKIKKDKSNNLSILTPLGKDNKVCDQNQHNLQEYSLNQLFNDNQRSFGSNHLQQTPIAHFNADQESSANHSRVRVKKRDSELIILQFKKDDDGDQNDSIKDAQTLRHNPPNFIHSNLDDDDISQITKNKNDGQDAERMHPNMLKLLDRQSYQSDEEQRNDNGNFMTIQQKNTGGLMCINQHGDEEREIEQIDLNSPNKRRSNVKSIMDDQSQHKKKKIKYSNSNNKRRVIKFTSGQPYLEYLPNMLSKQTNKHNKRSQPINFKNEFELYDQKPPRKSLKKIKREPKINFGQNNQNQAPEAIEIEDL